MGYQCAVAPQHGGDRLVAFLRSSSVRVLAVAVGPGRTSIAGKEVPEVDTPSGEDAAHEALCGDKGFTSKNRLKQFASGRNDPANLDVRPPCPAGPFDTVCT